MMMIAFLYLAAASAAGCRVVADDVIRMRDLAVAEPAFSSLDGALVVTVSPLPGAIRVLQAAELARLARRHGIADGEFRNVCFQRAMRQLDEQDLLDAFSHTLGIPTAEVELVDFSQFPAPVGDLVFPRSGLALTRSEAPLLWKGYVLYGDGHHFSIWARVKVRARLNRVVATDNLVTSRTVRADQVRIEPLDGVPDALAPAQSLEQVVGKTLLHPVRSGTTLSLDDISTAVFIRRGDKVDVDFQTPVVHLRFEAAAETDGHFGDRISLRNLQSRKIFVAEVSGRDQARVAPSTEDQAARAAEKNDKEAVDVEANGSGALVRAPRDPCDGGAKEAEGCQ